MSTTSRRAPESERLDLGPLLKSDLRNRAIANAIELERAEIRFEPLALGILGAVYDLGHMSCEDLAARIETSEEWIWFSRLQRARLVQDVGNAFSLSREGLEMVERLLSEASES